LQIALAVKHAHIRAAMMIKEFDASNTNYYKGAALNEKVQ
jgi:hypothetical protein